MEKIYRVDAKSTSLNFVFLFHYSIFVKILKFLRSFHVLLIRSKILNIKLLTNSTMLLTKLLLLSLSYFDLYEILNFPMSIPDWHRAIFLDKIMRCIQTKQRFQIAQRLLFYSPLSFLFYFLRRGTLETRANFFFMHHFLFISLSSPSTPIHLVLWYFGRFVQFKWKCSDVCVTFIIVVRI